MAISEADDRALVALAVSGELSAFDTLAKRHQPTLLRFLRRRLPSGDVEDAAQEVLVRAYQRLGQCRTAFRAWLLMIAYRETIDRHRRPKLAVVRDAEPASDHDPADAVMVRETGERLWAVARRTLSDQQFTALWLFYADDLNAKQIADVLGKSWIAVKVMLHRARVALKNELDQADTHSRRRRDARRGVKTVEAGEP